MSEFSASRFGETTSPLVRGWGLGSADSLGEGSLPQAGGGLSAPLDLSFHLADPEPESGSDRSRERTRTVGPPRATASPEIPFPSEGDVVGGFRIVSELGRGAFARVYLAEQVDLAGRPVALKVAEALGEEPQALARLQHAHIVPIYSVHDDAATGLRLLCMPYVGGANLAQVLEESGARSPTQADGGTIVAALDHVGGRPPTPAAGSRCPSRRDAPEAYPRPHVAARGAGSPTAVRSVLGRYWARLPWAGSLAAAASAAEVGSAPVPPEDHDQPARRFLRSHTYVQAAAWIGARLAEGLDHAHARGILHRDLKPSNILVANDGTPMLLDFNLAADADEARADDGGERARIGGTLPYMAPEHLDAFNPMGHTAASAVDERSDLYALGLILFEMATGRPPFDEPPPGLPILEVVARMTEQRRRGAPSARSINPAIAPSLDAIIAKALDPEPDRRYGRAQELAEDLQRFLDDRPNAHAPEPSLRERAAKWCRRHPEARGAWPMFALAATLLLAVGAAAWSVARYAEGAGARLRLASFRDDFARCQLLLNTANGPATHRADGIALAGRLLNLYGAGSDPEWRKSPMVARLPKADRLELREEVSELMLLMARARVAQAGRKAPEPVRRAALSAAVAQLDQAAEIDPRPSSALYATRAKFLAAMGDAPRAAADRARVEATPPTSSRDFYLRGTEQAANGRQDLAEQDLERAVAMDPRRFWAWFVLGLCHYDGGRYADAAGDFNACTLLAPDFAWPHLNRGLALAALGRHEAARAAFDRALALSPDFVEARVDRALVSLQLDDPKSAWRDLSRAVALGNREAGTLAARAEALSRLGRRDLAERDFADALAVRPNDPRVLVARGVSRIDADPDAAAADLRKVLARDPRNSRAHYGLALLLRRSDPEAAIGHASRALDADPEAFDALRVRAVLNGRRGDPAADADADRLAHRPSAQNLYNAACALALLDARLGATTHRAMAREYLRRAIDLGFPKATADADPDLATIRQGGSLR